MPACVLRTTHGSVPPTGYTRATYVPGGRLAMADWKTEYYYWKYSRALSDRRDVSVSFCELRFVRLASLIITFVENRVRCHSPAVTFSCFLRHFNGH